jgi:cyclopropane fatty-acyl-phospholipid synthase-like methyltransferase
VSSYANVQEVVAHFEGKTAAILQRYGPGPRVHYHAGLLDKPLHLNGSAKLLREQLVVAQERTLSHATQVWDASSTLCGDVLDVGCGLGGGAIFWAQECGARVTAVTCVPSHVNWVAHFAGEAGVGLRVQPLLCDALEVPGKNCFDAAVAVDSSCYLPRKPWFLRLASLLRPGGRAFIIDCFLARLEYAKPFDRYWHTNIGTIDEYLTAASDAHLRTVSVEDISHRTVHFWTTTLALIRIEAQNKELSSTELARYEESLRAHSLVREGLTSNGLRYCLMSFCKDG